MKAAHMPDPDPAARPARHLAAYGRLFPDARGRRVPARITPAKETKMIIGKYEYTYGTFRDYTGRRRLAAALVIRAHIVTGSDVGHRLIADAEGLHLVEQVEDGQATLAAVVDWIEGRGTPESRWSPGIGISY